MEFTAEEQKAIDVAKEHNVGDLALGRHIGQTRGTLANHVALSGNIEPMDVINRASPGRNYSFVWVPFDDKTDDFYFDCKQDGYLPVIESEWILVDGPFEFGLADTQKKRWSATRLLIRRNEFAMYRDEAKFMEQMDRRAGFNDTNIEKRYDDWQENAVRRGVDTSAVIAGKSREVQRGSRRPTVDLGDR